MTHLSYEICEKLKTVVDQTLKYGDWFYWNNSEDKNPHLCIDTANSKDSNWRIKIPSLEDLLGCLTVYEYEDWVSWLDGQLEEWVCNVRTKHQKDHFKSILAKWIVRERGL